MDYDVLILGGGLEGCAIAYELSKYNLNIALIEKNYDIAHDISHINTSVIYSGIENDNTLISKLESMGNSMLDEVTEKFKVPFKRCGALYVATNEQEEKVIEKIFNRSKEIGVEGIVILEADQAKKIEPNLSITITKALYSKNSGVICPFDLAMAYAEVAFDNNVNFKLEEEVLDIKKGSKGYNVITSKNRFTCKIVVNTINNKKYSIEDSEGAVDEKKGTLKYFLFNDSYDNKFSNIVFKRSEENNSVYVVPSISGNMVGSVNAKSEINNIELLEKFSGLIEDVNFKNIRSFYESPFYSNQIVIDESKIDAGYIKVVGKHYALVTMSPAIAKIVCETIVSNINCKLKRDFNDKRREYYKLKELSDEDKMNIIKLDKRYGNIICSCNMISEGEIIDAIRRPLGARTVEGVKRRTGACIGTCFGSQCMSKIINILARETNKKMTDIVKDSKNSKMLLNRIKEFDTI